jgi:hypothetical protein
MSTVFVTMDGATLLFADLPADLPATPDVTATCQIISAAVRATSKTETTPATLCSSESTRVVGIDRSLELSYFQDWTDPAGMCWWLQDHAGEDAAFQLTLEDGGTFAGTCQVVPGDYGGAAGSSLQATSSLPARDVVATPPPIVLAADAELEDDAELAAR